MDEDSPFARKAYCSSVMEQLWLTLYIPSAVAAVTLAVLMALQTWENRRFARSRVREMAVFRPRGRALLLAPCKGADVGLEDNLRALLEQDYDDYEVVFIVESDDDAACASIRRLLGAHPAFPARLVVAGRATERGQKVHSLCVATEHLSPNIRYLAFVDSDARPHPQWLRCLLALTDRPDCGAATGYRWFAPETSSLANAVLYSINCNVTMLLGRGGRNLIWGGSWAMRRDRFDELQVRQAWAGSLSDDLEISRLLLARRLKILFQPPCVVASPLNLSFSGMFGFLRRQYLLSRFYLPGHWAIAIGGATFSNFIWTSSLATLVYNAIHGRGIVGFPLVIMALLYALGAFRSWTRQDLVRTYFPTMTERFRVVSAFDVFAAPLAGLVNFASLIASMFGSGMTWRGIHYRLSRGGKLVAISHPRASVSAPANAAAENRIPSQRHAA